MKRNVNPILKNFQKIIDKADLKYLHDDFILKYNDYKSLESIFIERDMYISKINNFWSIAASNHDIISELMPIEFYDRKLNCRIETNDDIHFINDYYNENSSDCKGNDWKKIEITNNYEIDESFDIDKTVESRKNIIVDFYPNFSLIKNLKVWFEKEYICCVEIILNPNKYITNKTIVKKFSCLNDYTEVNKLIWKFYNNSSFFAFFSENNSSIEIFSIFFEFYRNAAFYYFLDC
ncbi:hypothetical protein DMUE_1234 [Dictyocoela muelleri]|nr:hypothetical protein DMUE_1234 [Dictyocoela muelleri]